MLNQSRRLKIVIQSFGWGALDKSLSSQFSFPYPFLSFSCLGVGLVGVWVQRNIRLMGGGTREGGGRAALDTNRVQRGTYRISLNSIRNVRLS